MAANMSIKAWMKRNVSRFVDVCGEVNCTALVEAWDAQEANGSETLDNMHPAWDIAVDVGEWYESTRKVN
jgi:hypothetical protein